MTSMIRGLIDEETAEDSDINVANKKLLVPYADRVVPSLNKLFSSGISTGYQPLQEEVLSTLSCFASVLDSAFAPHYDAFMPGLIGILRSNQASTE